LIGEGAGIGPTLFLAEQMRAPLSATATHNASAVPNAHTAARAPAAHTAVAPSPWNLLVLLGSETHFPFRPRPSVIVVPGIPAGIIACMPLLEGWGIASRLASTLDLPGCFEGTVAELADTWLSSLGQTDLAKVEIFSRGPTPMLEAIEALARRHGVPYQVSM
jgi:hypothetical protein